MDKYDVKKVVGEGSYGKAVLCKRKVDSRLCIIKQISIKKMSRKEALLTEQEATLLKRLQHPNIVSFWESFVTSNSLYIVMEYADGGDLDHYIKAHAKAVPRREIPEKQVLHMFVQLALAIKHIHDRKILHRDLKSQVSVLLFVLVTVPDHVGPRTERVPHHIRPAQAGRLWCVARAAAYGRAGW
jgi:NIMA (never in mitosis gene a)-related kinase